MMTGIMESGARYALRGKAGCAMAVIFLVVIGITGMFAGCTSELRPLSVETVTAPEQDEGLALGRVHLVYNGKDLRSGLRLPATIGLWMSDEVSKKHFLVSDLSADGPFILKVPTGSYRIDSLVFHDGFREWIGDLQGGLTVSPGCTYLGTWNLAINAGTFAGQAVGTVINEVEEMSDIISRIQNTAPCTPTIALLKLPAEVPVRIINRMKNRD